MVFDADRPPRNSAKSTRHTFNWPIAAMDAGVLRRPLLLAR
jgi:hypothetical protein